MALRSIASRLALWVLAGSTLVLAVSGGMLFSRTRAQILQHAHREATALADSAASKIQARIDHVSAATQLLAGLIVSRRNDAEPLLRDALVANKDLAGLSADFIPDAEGHVSTPAPFVGRQDDGSLSQRDLRNDATRYWKQPWFTSGLDCPAGCWQQTFMSVSRHRRLINYSAPMHGDAPVGVINADVTLDWLQGVLHTLRKPGGSYAFVLDSNGDYLAHDHAAAIGHRADAALLAAMASGADRRWRLPADAIVGLHEPAWVYRAPIESTHWSFGLVVPESRIYAGVRRLFLINIVLGLLALFCIALIVMAVTRRTLQPLRVLANRAEHVARGELDFVLPPVKRLDEIGRLTRSFDQMRNKLALHLQHMADAARQQQRLSSELEIARQIQTALLPNEHYLDARCAQFELHAALRPARAVGGDLYSYFMLNNENFCVMVGDVSDKGIPAALFMARTITLAKALAMRAHDPPELLQRLNRELCRSNESCMFVSLLYGMLDTNRGTLTLASAGHEPPILCGRGAPQLIDIQTGPVLGLDEDATYPALNLAMLPGDTLLMYTDGITEATDHDTRMFGIERTLASLAGVADLAEPASYTSQLLADVADFVGQAPQSDDITLLALNWGRGDDETAPATLEATIGSRLEEVFGLIARCDTLLGERDIPAPLREDIQLVLEELLVNIVEHGQADSHIALQLRLAARTIVIELHNDGEAFDPLQSRPPVLTGDIADREQLGGLGIHLVQSMVSHMSHTHDTRGNHLLLRFNRFDPLDTDGATS